MHRSIWVETTPETNYPTLKGDIETEVAIIGGGVVGLMSAFRLIQDGKKVVLLEARDLIQLVSGYTTAKISSAHGIIYNELIENFGLKKAKIYADANEHAIEEADQLVKKMNIDCDFHRHPAYIYVREESRLAEQKAEFESARKLGLPVSFENTTELPYKVAGTIKYDNQAAFHPRKFLLAIADAVTKTNAQIFTKSRVIDYLDYGNKIRLKLAKGSILADKVIVVTNFPIFDPNFYFARLKPRQSYALALEIDGKIPQGLYYSPQEKDFESLRPYMSKEAKYLIVGGGLHVTGQVDDTMKKYEKLEKWARDNFTVKNITYRWSTHDLETGDRVPLIGQLAPGDDRFLLATGFKGWGVSHGILASKILRDMIVGEKNDWLKLYSPSRLSSYMTKDLVKKNIKVIKTLIKGRIKSYPKESFAYLKKGEGRIVEDEDEKRAVYRDENGQIYSYSPYCTHMGCVVSWNNAERTWDCPCHGSRFDANGTVIHPPAVEPLISEQRKEAMSKETVEIKNHAYNPPSLGAMIGDQVTWTNYDEDEHSVTFENDEYPERELHKGESYTLTFDKEGTFAYYCRYHPKMKAKIVVG